MAGSTTGKRAAIAYDLTTAAYDRQGPPVPVAHSYLLCSMPRSGSSLLSEALHGLGVLGTPIEYFDPTATFVELWHRWNCQDLDDYVAHLHRYRVSDGGIFGAKLHWFHLSDLASAMGTDEVSAVRRIFPRCRFVFVTRRDRLRQAVSWAIALQTWQWSDGAGDDRGLRAEATYDGNLIDDCYRRIVDGERSWRSFFAAVGQDGGAPLEVAYEDLVEHFAGTVAAVAAELGAPVDPSDVPPPRLRRQADHRTDAMLERYLAERSVSPPH